MYDKMIEAINSQKQFEEDYRESRKGQHPMLGYLSKSDSRGCRMTKNIVGPHKITPDIDAKDIKALEDMIHDFMRDKKKKDRGEYWKPSKWPRQ